jgi:hypothetical protein
MGGADSFGALFFVWLALLAMLLSIGRCIDRENHAERNTRFVAPIPGRRGKCGHTHACQGTDTRTLVREYLETDPELAEIAREAVTELPDDNPIPLTEEIKMKAYRKAQRLILQRNIVWAVLIALALLSLFGWLR